MSSTKSSKGDKQATVHQRGDGKFVVEHREGRDPLPPRDRVTHSKDSFPANRTLRQGELPKR